MSLTEYPTTLAGDLVSWEGDIVLERRRLSQPYLTPMVPNTPFTDRLQLLGFERGRSSAVFTWAASDGRRFQMFLVDMLEAIRLFGMEPAQVPPEAIPARWADWREEVKGYCSGRWHVVKRGQNYGIAPTKEGR